MNIKCYQSNGADFACQLAGEMKRLIRSVGHYKEEEMITIREMKSSEIDRIAEIDRTEHITQYYTLRNALLEVNDVDWHVGPWDSAMKTLKN